MTVKELKEKLNKFDDRLVIMIPDNDSPIGYTSATHIARGSNEADGCVFICDYTEDEDEETI